MRRRHRSGSLTLAVLIALVPASPADAYLKFSFTGDGQTVTLRWPGRVRYFVREAGVGGVSASQLQTAVARAAASWQDLPTASIAFDFAGFTSAPPLDTDDLTVIGFEDHPELDRVLGATSFNFDDRTGAITDADIFLNARFDWSVAAAGQPGRYDVESIAAHEIGHLIGLGHSMIGETELRPDGRRVIAAESIMFPIALSAGNIDGRRLRPDDIAGASDLYPDQNVEQRTGAISGRVLDATGRGLLGAHVVAMSLSTGHLVSAFSVNANGEFAIARLPMGIYVVRVEPLDDADLDSVFERGTTVNVDFRVTFFERPVAVPRGGAGPPLEIRVADKR